MCKWNQDEFCVNADCPYCADYCPVDNYDSICKYMEDEENETINDRRIKSIRGRRLGVD